MKRLARLLGMPGVAGFGVLVSCAAFYLFALAPTQHDISLRFAHAERLRSRASLQPVGGANAAAAELARFHALFPPLDRLPEEVERLHRLARAAGLTPTQGEYRLEPLDGGLAAYRVTLPLRGRYEQVRQFLGSVLSDMPIASIDGLRFERKKADDPVLESRLRFTIHFRRSVKLAGG